MKLSNATYNPKEGLSRYIIKIEGIWSEFANLGVNKDETTKKAALLKGIQTLHPSTFENLITQPDLSYDEIKRATISAASFEKTNFEYETMESESALKCTHCHRNNHETKQCWVKNPELRPRKENRVNPNYKGNKHIKCFNCGKLGHISRNCRNQRKCGRKCLLRVLH